MSRGLDARMMQLAEYRDRKEGLEARLVGARASVTKLLAALREVDMQVARLMKDLFGIEVAQPPPPPSPVAEADRTLVQETTQESPSPPDLAPAQSPLSAPSPQPVASPPEPKSVTMYQPTRDTARVIGIDDEDDLDLWLLNDVARLRWRRVQVVRRALERLGGCARLGPLLVETLKDDGSFDICRLRSLLRRPNGHFVSHSGLWRYRHGGPELTPREAVVFRFMLQIKSRIEGRGGAASFGDLLDHIQRENPVSVMNSAKLSRYLRDGPFRRDERCQWAYSPGIRGEERRRTRWEAATLEESGYDAASLGVPRLPTDPGHWDAMVRTPEQAKKWCIVKAVGSVVERLGNEVRQVDIHRKLVEEHGVWSEGSLSALLSLDPHFYRPHNLHRWAFQPGPPSLTPRQMKMWYREIIVREALEWFGGHAPLRLVHQAVIERGHPDSPSTATLWQMLKNGPYTCDQTSRLWQFHRELEQARLERLYATVGPLSLGGKETVTV